MIRGASPEWLGAGAAEVLSRLHRLVVTMSCISSSILIRLRCLDRQAVDTLTLTKKNRQTPQKDRQTPQRHTSSEIFFTDEREISWRRVMVPLEHARATGAWLP